MTTQSELRHGGVFHVHTPWYFTTMTQGSRKQPFRPGDTYGRLTIVRADGRYPIAPSMLGRVSVGPPAVWVRCACGTELRVRWSVLQGGHTKSCGCLSREKSAERAIRRNVEDKPALKHGLTQGVRHPNYQRAVDAIKRCHHPDNPAYPNYGARGIRVHEPWRSDITLFVSYLDSMGDCPEGCSMDRVDNNGHYEPGNLRWATPSEQLYNQRRNGNNAYPI